MTWLPLILLLACPAMGRPNITFAGPLAAQDDNGVRAQWRHMEKVLRTAMRHIVSRYGTEVFRLNLNSSLSAQCTAALVKITRGTLKLETWAISYLDASGKLPEGFLGGTTASLGSYDQCLGLRSPPGFQGKYCMLHLRPALPPLPTNLKEYPIFRTIPELKNLSNPSSIISDLARIAQVFYYTRVRQGVCMPSACGDQDVLNLATSVAGVIHWNVSLSHCHAEGEPVTISLLQHIVIGAFLVLCGLVIAGTAVEVWGDVPAKPSASLSNLVSRVLACFSILSTTRKVFCTRSLSAHNDNLGFFHGIRVLSMTWVLLGHSYYTFLTVLTIRSMRTKEWYIKDFAFQPIINGFLSVDSFFFMSGFLLAYFPFKKNQKLGFFGAFFKRLWRVLPPYIALIALAFVFPLLGSGPNWPKVSNYLVGTCPTLWWQNLLFVNNLFDSEFIYRCMGHTWFLAVDMQIYIPALLVLTIWLRKPRLGFLLSVNAILLSMLSTGYVTYIKGHSAAFDVYRLDLEFWLNVYFKPYPHVGPYFVGLITGYWVAKNPKVQLSRRSQVAGWTLATALCTTSLYGAYAWNSGLLTHRDSLLTMLYGGTHRVAWCAGLAWMTAACYWGAGGLINELLSWKGFLPLSRLAFLSYLIHFPVIFFYMGTERTEAELSHIRVVWFFFGLLCISMLCAFLYSAVLVSPLLALKSIRGSGPPSSRASKLAPEPAASSYHIVSHL